MLGLHVAVENLHMSRDLLNSNTYLDAYSTYLYVCSMERYMNVYM